MKGKKKINKENNIYKRFYLHHNTINIIYGEEMLKL